MTTNQYDTPAQAQFINTYVPIPFQEMMQAGAVKQRGYEEGQSRADALVDAYTNIKVAPIDMATKNMRIKQINDELSKLVDEHPDLGSYEFKRKLSKFQRDVATDPWWTAAQANVKPYEELVRDIETNKSKNLSYNTRAQQEYFKLLQKEGTEGLIKRGLNNGSIMNPGATEYADFNKYVDDSLARVKASGITNQYYDKDGMKILSGKEGVTLDALKKGINAERDSFFSSKEGKNFVNMVADSLGGNLTEEDLNKAYENLIDTRARKFVHGSTQSKQDYDSAYDKKQQDSKFADFDLTGDANTSKTNVPDYSKYNAVNLPDFKEMSLYAMATLEGQQVNLPNSKVSLKSPEMAKRIGTVQGKHGIDKDTAIKALNNNLNYWLSPQFNNYNVIRPADAKSLSERYNNNIEAVQLYDKNGTLYKGDEREKLLTGYKDLQIGSLVVNPSSKSEGAYLSGTITKADGTVESVNLALPRHMRGAGILAASLDKLKNEAVLTGKSQSKTEEIGNGYSTKTKVNYNETKTKDGFVMQPTISQYTIDNKGNIVDKAEDIPYAEYKTMLEEQLMSQINGVNKK